MMNSKFKEYFAAACLALGFTGCVSNAQSSRKDVVVRELVDFQEFKSPELQEVHRKYYSLVEQYEKSSIFVPSEEARIALSVVETCMTALDNVNELAALEYLPNESLIEENAEVKKLLMELKEIQNQDLSSYKKVEEMYYAMCKKIKAGEECVDGSKGLDFLVAGNGGDCNEVATAFFSFYAYLGFDCKLVFGDWVSNDGKRISHLWLSMNVDGHVFELDPTWYQIFVPLTPRNSEIKPFSD